MKTVVWCSEYSDCTEIVPILLGKPLSFQRKSVSKRRSISTQGLEIGALGVAEGLR